MEYALMVALVAVVCIGAVTFVGTSGSGKLDKAGKGVEGGTTVPAGEGLTLLMCSFSSGMWHGTYQATAGGPPVVREGPGTACPGTL